MICANSVSANLPRNAISIITKNITSTVSIDLNDKKVRYKMVCHTLHTLLILITLLFIISIIGYHHKEHQSKQKHIGALTI